MVDTLVLYFHVHIWISFVRVSVGEPISFEVLFTIHAWPSASVLLSVYVYWLHACCLQLKTQLTVLFAKGYILLGMS